jgi:hypothetical protein
METLSLSFGEEVYQKGSVSTEKSACEQDLEKFAVHVFFVLNCYSSPEPDEFGQQSPAEYIRSLSHYHFPI